MYHTINWMNKNIFCNILEKFKVYEISNNLIVRQIFLFFNHSSFLHILCAETKFGKKHSTRQFFPSPHSPHKPLWRQVFWKIFFIESCQNFKKRIFFINFFFVGLCYTKSFLFTICRIFKIKQVRTLLLFERIKTGQNCLNIVLLLNT